jgi:hypothetical protein
MRRTSARWLKGGLTLNEASSTIRRPHRVLLVVGWAGRSLYQGLMKEGCVYPVCRAWFVTESGQGEEAGLEAVISEFVTVVSRPRSPSVSLPSLLVHPTTPQSTALQACVKGELLFNIFALAAVVIALRSCW